MTLLFVGANNKNHWIAFSDVDFSLQSAGNSGAFLCVPGMGMILWVESPLYIFQKDILYDSFKMY